MSEVKKLDNRQLHTKLKGLAADERKLLSEILQHIAEVDRRKLFLQMAYPSLFEYLTKEIGYSAGAAQRRIDAARLLQRIPELARKVENGDVNLMQIAKLQAICRQVKKESGVSVATETKREILLKIEKQGVAQTNLILAQSFQTKVQMQEKKSIQRDESVRIELTFAKEEMAIIEEANARLSHKTGGRLKDLVLEMAKKVLKEATRESTSKTTSTVEVTNSTAESKLLTSKSATPKSVTPKLRRQILTRDQVCQFRDGDTGKICGSRHFLEVDHVQPRFMGGGHDSQNLRALCKSHNIYRYQAGV